MTSQYTLVRKLVLDVLKPRKPSIVEFAFRLASINGAKNINVTSAEIDQNSENIRMKLAGDNINIEEVKKEVEGLGAAIHSIDEVVAGKKGATPI